MYYYEVKFRGTPNRSYYYRAIKPLIVEGVYFLTVDYKHKYDSKAIIYREVSKKEFEFVERTHPEISFRTITDAKACTVPPRPSDRIKNVWFNEKKGTTCVEWDDGIKTLVTCQPGDTFSREFGIALCYMKRLMKNRACYNDVFRKWGCYDD